MCRSSQFVDADTQGQMVHPLLQTPFAQIFHQLIGDDHELLGRPFRMNQDELVRSDSRNEAILFIKHQTRGKERQHRISRTLTKLIVDAAEVVEIDSYHTNRLGRVW